MTRSRTPLLALSALLLAACDVAPTAPGPGCAGGKCDGSPYEPTEVLACSIDDGSPSTVTCTFHGTSAAHPVQIDLSVAALKTVSTVGESSLGSARFDTPGASADILEVDRSQFPVLVSITANLRSEDAELGALRTLTAAWRIERPGADSRSWALPFATWPLALETDDGAYFQGRFAPSTVTTAPFETFLSETEVTLEPELLVLEPTELALVTPPEQATLTAEGRFCDGGECTDLTLTFERPGRYRITRDGLVPVSAVVEDDAGELPVLDGGAPIPTDGDVSIVDGGTDAGPSCGVDGLAPCADGCAEWHEESGGVCRQCGHEGQRRCIVSGGAHVCADGHVWVSSEAACRECGGDGQRRCQVGSDYVCDEGHVYSSSDNLCHVCGGEGELRCYVDGDYVCDDGFVHTSSDNRCHECGGEGQLRCYVDGDYVCDDGFVYSTSDYRCHECGGDGQLRCYVGGSYLCDEGHRYSSSDNRCHAE